MAHAEVRLDAPPGRVMVTRAMQMEALVRRYYELFNERKLDEAERFVDPQALFTYPVGKEHLIGRAGYRELTRRWLEGFPDARIEITAVLMPDPHTAATEWIGHGTHLGTLELPGFPALPPTGIHTHLPMREIVTIADGRIVESRMEFEPAEMLRRLGFPSG